MANGMDEDMRRVDEVFAEFNARVNMSPQEIDAWDDSLNFEIYSEQKAGGEDIDKVHSDIIRLLETPKNEWSAKDDGFNEVEEANQAIDFIDRMRGVEPGDPMDESAPPLSKRDASLLNWGFDPNPRQSDFTGDLQQK
jgi:hypothetical protein